MKLFVTLVCLISVTVSQNIFKHCDYVKHLDCTTFAKTPVCGTDGHTYLGDCELAVAHCKTSKVHQAHKGACSTTMTTSAPNHGHTQTLVQSVFCRAVENVDCSSHVKENICASNGKTYESMCVYEKARCHHDGLHLVNC